MVPAGRGPLWLMYFTSMSKPAARRATAWPIRPMPTIPSDLPYTSRPTSRRIGEHARRVRHQNTALSGCFHINIVVADRHIGDHFQPRPSRVHYLCIDSIVEETVERVHPAHAAE